MSKDDDGSYDDDKIIDITDHVDYHKNEDDRHLDEFTNQFVTMINETIVERQKKVARERFIHFMINFLLLTQVGVAVAITFIIMKLYS